MRAPQQMIGKTHDLKNFDLLEKCLKKHSEQKLALQNKASVRKKLFGGHLYLMNPLTDTDNALQVKYNEPILFRTVGQEVYNSSLKNGSLWLRSDTYYREIEDIARKDLSEGVNSSKLGLPIIVDVPNGPQLSFCGEGHIGQEIRSHYIVSLHGLSISKAQLNEFGGHTFGVRSIIDLSTEVLFEAAKQLRCIGYRYGQVSYQRTPLALILGSCPGAAAVKLSDNPPIYLNPPSTDVLRKDPVLPFIEQDEWRIVIFTDGYLHDDPHEPLKIEVSPKIFFPYQNSLPEES